MNFKFINLLIYRKWNFARRCNTTTQLTTLLNNALFGSNSCCSVKIQIRRNHIRNLRKIRKIFPFKIKILNRPPLILNKNCSNKFELSKLLWRERYTKFHKLAYTFYIVKCRYLNLTFSYLQKLYFFNISASRWKYFIFFTWWFIYQFFLNFFEILNYKNFRQICYKWNFNTSVNFYFTNKQAKFSVNFNTKLEYLQVMHVCGQTNYPPHCFFNQRRFDFTLNNIFKLVSFRILTINARINLIENTRVSAYNFKFSESNLPSPSMFWLCKLAVRHVPKFKIILLHLITNFCVDEDENSWICIYPVIHLYSWNSFKNIVNFKMLVNRQKKHTNRLYDYGGDKFKNTNLNVLKLKYFMKSNTYINLIGLIRNTHILQTNYNTLLNFPPLLRTAVTFNSFKFNNNINLTTQNSYIKSSIIFFEFLTSERLLFKNYLLRYYRSYLLTQKFKFRICEYSYPSIYITSLLLKYVEYFTNTKTYLFINFEFYKKLSALDLLSLFNCYVCLIRTGLKFSTIFFLDEFLDLMYLMFKLRDTNFLLDYIQRILSRLIIWDHKKFLVFIFNVIREHFYPMFHELKVVGLHCTIRGKLSVTGNSRKRSLKLILGKTSVSSTYYSTDYTNKIINTNTGVLGFQLLIISN